MTVTVKGIQFDGGHPRHEQQQQQQHSTTLFLFQVDKQSRGDALPATQFLTLNQRTGPIDELTSPFTVNEAV